MQGERHAIDVTLRDLTALVEVGDMVGPRLHLWVDQEDLEDVEVVDVAVQGGVVDHVVEAVVMEEEEMESKTDVETVEMHPTSSTSPSQDTDLQIYFDP